MTIHAQSGQAVGSAALIANPALKGLEFLVGDWCTTGTHPARPGKTLVGRTSFNWHEGGAFLLMRSEVHDPLFPDGVALIGSDNGAGKFSMLYFDERGVSRIIEVRVGDQSVQWQRDNREIAQSLVISVMEGGNKLVSKGLISQHGGAWADDLSQVFERADRVSSDSWPSV